MLDSNTIIIVASILRGALIGVGASFFATRGLWCRHKGPRMHGPPA